MTLIKVDDMVVNLRLEIIEFCISISFCFQQIPLRYFLPLFINFCPMEFLEFIDCKWYVAVFFEVAVILAENADK